MSCKMVSIYDLTNTTPVEPLTVNMTTILPVQFLPKFQWPILREPIVAVTNI